MKIMRLIPIFFITGLFVSALILFFINIYPIWVSWRGGESPRGIILISLDTLRADHLGIYGYYRNTSPYIDAFAKENIVLEHAVAQSHWTIPSHMSIMTSLYPHFHGVTEKNTRLAEEQVTLAELLREGGYQTAAFTDSGYMRAVFGFDQGFDTYDDVWRVGIANIIPKAIKWLNKHKSKPFFLFIHCYDIHSPYNPPPPYNSIFHNFNYTGNFIPNGKNIEAAARHKIKLTGEDIRHIKALYDGGIRYTDEKIGEFLSYLRKSGLQEQSLIIITSDHGEEFNEHGSFAHGSLYYRPNLHVPLIMSIPNYPKKGTRINTLVQSIDILPTILEIAQLPPHPKAQGESLLPLIRQNISLFNRPLILHPLERDSNISFAQKGRSVQYSTISGDYQMIHKNKTTKDLQLFNIKTDPLAKNNIAKDHDEIIQQLLSRFKETYNATPPKKGLPISLDEQTRGQLEALGYIK